MAKRRFDPPEFKAEAVRLVRERGVSVRQAARELGLHPNVLRGWVQAARTQPTASGVAPTAAEGARLQREVARLKMERDILTKAAAFFAQEVK